MTAMDKQRAIRLFVRIVDAGSFTAVADELNITTSVISKEVRRLEDELRVPLMHRSTRGQQLTAIGEGYLQRCRELLIQMDDADAYVQHMQSNPQEKLPIPSADMLLVVAADHPLGLVASNPQAIVEQLPHYRRIVIHDTARHNVLRN